MGAGRFPEARDAYQREVASCTGPSGVMARLYCSLADAEREMAAYDSAIAAADAGLKCFEATSDPEMREARVGLLTARGRALAESGRTEEAELVLQEAVEAERSDTIAGAQALRALGEVRFAQARYAEAEQMYARAMETLLRLLPPTHRERGHAVNSWGLAAAQLGRLTEAEERLLHGLDLRQAALPPSHPDIGESLHNLATVAVRRGKLDEGESRTKQALAIWEQILGSSHPRIALALGTLGAIAQKRGRFADAEQLYRRGLEIREASLGPDHPRLIPSLNNIASVLHKAGDNAGAEQLFRRSLAIAETRRGPTHPEVARALNNLSTVVDALGRTDEASSLLQRAVAIWERSLGPDSPELAASLINLAAYEHAHGDRDAAEQTLLRVLSIKSRALGDNHPDLATPLNNLGNLYVETGRLDRAEELYLRAERLRRDAGYTSSTETLFNLSEIARRQGRIEAQHGYLRNAIAVTEQNLGPAAPKLSTYLRHLGRALRELGDNTGSLDALSRALAAAERARAGPVEMAQTLTALGFAQASLGKNKQASATYRRGIEVLEKAGNPEPLLTAELLVLLGVLLVRTGNPRQARVELAKARDLALAARAENNTLARSALLWQGYADIALGDTAAAERSLLGTFGQGDQATGADDMQASQALHGLRHVYRKSDRPGELTAVLENLMAMRGRQGATDHEVAGILRELGDCYFAAQRFAEAAAIFRRVLMADTGAWPRAFSGSTSFFLALSLAQLRDDAAAAAQFAASAASFAPAPDAGPPWPGDPTSLALCLSVWVEFLAVRGRATEASTPAEQLRALLDAHEFGAETCGSADQSLGTLYLVLQRWDEAEAALKQSLLAWEDPAASEVVGLNAVMVRHQLARLEHLRGRPEEAESIYWTVIHQLETAGPAAAQLLPTVRQDLATLLTQSGRHEEAEVLRRQTERPAA